MSAKGASDVVLQQVSVNSACSNRNDVIPVEHGRARGTCVDGGVKAANRSVLVSRGHYGRFECNKTNCQPFP